jgi:hypothetical protein
VQRNALALHARRALLYHIDDFAIKRVAKRYVTYESALEEGKGADSLGAVDDLVRDDEVHGLDLLLQGAHGAEGDHAAHADVAERGDVGAGGNLVRRILVVDTVAGEEGDGDVVVLEDQDGRRGLTPWCLRVELCDGRVPVDLVEASTANDGDVNRSCKTTMAFVRITKLFRMFDKFLLAMAG